LPSDAKLIIGDFNAPHINWSSGICEASVDSFENRLLEALKDGFWTQHVTAETRNPLHERSSLLDLVLTDEPELIDLIKHSAPLGKSDHDVLDFQLNIAADAKDRPHKVLDWMKGDFEQIRINCAGIDWHKESENKSVEQFHNELQTFIDQQIQQHIPYRLIRNGNSRKGETRKGRNFIKKKKKLRVQTIYCIKISH
jgi:hypothetical protein